MEEDFYCDSNLEYKKAEAYPSIQCPTENMITLMDKNLTYNDSNKVNSKYEYINANQEIIFLANDEFNTIDELTESISTTISINYKSFLDNSIENDKIFYSADKIKDIAELYNEVISSANKKNKSFKEIK